MESSSSVRCLKMGAPWTTEDRAVLFRAVSKYECRQEAPILHSCSPSHCFSCVEDVDASHPADLLVASPPCLLYSKANRHSTYADQMAEATRVIGELRRILGLLRPRLLILEQTSSLVTHCPAAYQLYLGMCQDLPYIVLSYVVDAHRNCGGSHHRERLILLALAT